MPNPDILLILVNYFNEADTCAFVRDQVRSDRTDGPAVLIVNNGSRDADRLRQLTQDFAGVRVIEAGGNPGYLPGAALGLKTWLHEGRELPAALVVSNSDILLPGSFFRDEYLTAGRSRFDLIGPAIVSSRLKHHQNPLMRKRISRPKLRMLGFLSSHPVLHYLFLAWYFGKSKILAPLRKSPSPEGSIIPVYGIHGSFMIFHRSFFDKGGTLDYPNPLYGEEIWLGERALRLGLRIGFDPSLQVIHREHGTTGMFKSPELVRLMHRSYRYLLRHYDDP